MMTFRHITPVEPRDATGLVAEIYSQQARDMGMTRLRPLMPLSHAPDLMAAAWALLRESLVAGTVSRTERELVAIGVSERNRCPFCFDAHTMLLHATGQHRLAEAIARGERPADPRQAALLDGRGLDEPELMGTALAFHFVNRMVSTLHSPDVLPGGVQRWRAVRSLAGRAFASTVRRVAPPGDSLKLLTVRPDPPAWAEDSPVGTAYAALCRLAGDGDVPGLDTWDGGHPPLTHRWPDEPVARLRAKVALAPYRITDDDLDSCGLGPEELVRVIASGAVAAMRRHERLILAGTPL
ncbi:MAG: carboxymuconolactone decarboxylase family protein [Thermoactinospora sp.]|nr:carboxymuconolactone decarboxylase family protein [Thermoactinospora sp.]